MNKVTCPICHCSSYDWNYQPAIRQGASNGVNIVDVGYKCPKCEHEFGFEVLKDKNINQDRV